MSDYKELIGNLRKFGMCLYGEETSIMQTAADAIDQLVKIAQLLCEGFLDMPSGCDGCPLVDTKIYDEEGNGICELYRRATE